MYVQEHKKAILVGPVKESILLKEQKAICDHGRQDILWIAVDGGIAFFAANNRMPDLWIGDMDSYEESVEERAFVEKIPTERIRKVPVMKDDTDMALAVKAAYGIGCEEIWIFGGSNGDRVSHMLANIQMMHAYAKLGCHIQMISEKNRMEVLYQGIKKYPTDMKGVLSVLALTDQAEGVCIRGMKYDYEGILTNERALGVSNAFVGKESLVSVEKGALLLIYEEND